MLDQNWKVGTYGYAGPVFVSFCAIMRLADAPKQCLTKVQVLCQDSSIARLNLAAGRPMGALTKVRHIRGKRLGNRGAGLSHEYVQRRGLAAGNRRAYE
jgi:hypothetical protein